MEVETETMMEKREIINNVMCLLTDPDGTPLGSPMYLPQNAGPQHLNQIVNKLLNNEEKLPYAFYISDEELLVPLETYLQKNKVSVEKALPVVCQPQAIFRIRPVNRCSATISGHAEAVLSVAFSPDGRQLASGSGDTSVRFWDLSTQTPLYTCTGHKNWVLCIAWSPDGKYLVSGSKAGELICWDPQTGKSLGNPLTGHKKWITGISWEPVHLNAPCRRFVSASKDGDARIWDVSLKKCVMCLSGHTLAITCVKWGGDGVIYTGSQDCTIKVWETTQGKLIRELKGHGHWVNSLALSTEYVLRTGAFDHTGKQYSSPEEMRKVALERYQAMRGNAPERLVSGSDDFTMFLWEPFVSKHPKTRMTGHQQLVNHVYFSPDGLWVASASFDKSVKLWNGTTGKFVAAFRGHVGPVYQISWSADSRLLLSGSRDSTLKVWDIRTRKLKSNIPSSPQQRNSTQKMKQFHKVVFKPDSQSTDEFMVIVNGDEYKKWIKGDKTIPLADVVDSFDVFHTGTGAQGIMGRPSKQLLDTVFESHKDVDVVTHILERGQLQTASQKEAYSTTNDAKQAQNTTSKGSGAGFGGR